MSVSLRIKSAAYQGDTLKSRYLQNNSDISEISMQVRMSRNFATANVPSRVFEKVSSKGKMEPMTISLDITASSSRLS